MPNNRTSAHVPNGDRTFVLSKTASSKAYLQCLLSLDDLFSRGLSALAVRQPQSYYKLLRMVEGCSLVPPDLPAKARGSGGRV